MDGNAAGTERSARDRMAQQTVSTWRSPRSGGGFTVSASSSRGQHRCEGGRFHQSRRGTAGEKVERRSVPLEPDRPGSPAWTWRGPLGPGLLTALSGL